MTKAPKKNAKASAKIVKRSEAQAPQDQRGSWRGILRPTGYSTDVSAIYFYYLKERGGGKFVAQAYYYDHGDTPIRAEQFDGIVKRLTENAILDTDMPPKMAYDFDGAKWRRKSWLVVVLEDEDSAFDRYDPIVFDENNSDYDVNYSFGDGELIVTRPEIKGETLQLNGLRAINHMKRNEKGDPLLDGEKAKYKFRLNFSNSRRAHLLNYQDSGGTNMGPPVPPPNRL